MRRGLVVALAIIGALLLGACSPAEPESGDRNEVVATVLARIEADLGKPVKFDVKTFNSADGWALVDGQLQDTNGQPVAGVTSPRYNGLLKKTGAKWTILESAIGPTDVQWAGWKAKYPDAPAQIWP